MKKRVFNIIHNNHIFIKAIYGLIILNVVVLILESYKQFSFSNFSFFNAFEIFSVCVFSIEYLMRLWTSDLEKKYNGNSFVKRLRFTFSSFGLIDLFAILPFYLPFIFPFDLRILRILRLFRLLRIFKLGRYSKSLKTIGSVLKETKSDLTITIFVAFILLILSSTLMYYIENEAQPEEFGSIVHSLWWAITTLTTVGYGDVYPITVTGKILSGIIAIIGIGFVALPTGIISSAFIKKIQEQKEERKICRCPHCNKEIEINNIENL